MATQPALLELETLIRELNNPINQGAPQRIDAIQKQIQSLQRDPSAWQYGLDLLNHDDSMLRFYGALTLTIKVNADWDNDKISETHDLLHHLIQGIVTSYIRLAAIPDAPFVLQKLCTTVTAVFQRPDSAWALPIRHILACTIAGQYVPQDHVPDMSSLYTAQASITTQQLCSILQVAITLAEELASAGSTNRQHNLRVRMSNNLPDMWQLIRFCVDFVMRSVSASSNLDMSSAGLQVVGDSKQVLEVARLTLQLAPYWTTDIKAPDPNSPETNSLSLFSHFKVCVEAFVLLLEQPTLSSQVMRAFTSLEQDAHNLLRKSLPDYANTLVTSDHAVKWIQELRSGVFDTEATAYVDFIEAVMNQTDITTPDYLQRNQYSVILKHALLLLGCEGVAGIDDSICQIALEILSSATEGFSDWPEPSEYDDSMRQLVTETCGACLEKICIPLEELSPSTQSWDADDRDKFQDFRYDVRDYLQNAFSNLGSPLIEEIVRVVISHSDSQRWSRFEAGLFALNAFADTMSADPQQYDPYLESVFGSSNWNTAISTNSDFPERVRQMVIKSLGENTSFLQRNSQHLVPALNFLFSSLHVPAFANVASKTIYTICDAQRAMLTEALPQFMQSLATTFDLDIGVRNRVFGGVCAIIQALPSESAKIAPLSQILDLLRARIENIFETNSDTIELLTESADTVETLAAMGRGLRTSDDAVVDLEKQSPDNEVFWISGEGASIQQSTIQLFHVLRTRVNGETESIFIEAGCDFIRSAFTEDHPSPFKFSSEVTLGMLGHFLYAETPHPDLVIGTASGYLASTSPENTSHGFDALVSRIISLLQDVVLQQQVFKTAAYSEFCSATLDFFIRLLPKWGAAWLEMPRAQEMARVVLELGLTLVVDDDTLSRRTAASFFAAILETSGNPKIIGNEQARHTIDFILKNYIQNMLGSIFQLLGGECARSELEALSEPVKKAVSKQGLLANRIIKEAMKSESAILTLRALNATRPEQRARFAAQIEILRGASKTNEVIKEFWIACRGSNFGYVT